MKNKMLFEYLSPEELRGLVKDMPSAFKKLNSKKRSNNPDIEKLRLAKQEAKKAYGDDILGEEIVQEFLKDILS